MPLFHVSVTVTQVTCGEGQETPHAERAHGLAGVGM